MARSGNARGPIPRCLRTALAQRYWRAIAAFLTAKMELPRGGFYPWLTPLDCPIRGLAVPRPHLYEPTGWVPTHSLEAGAARRRPEVREKQSTAKCGIALAMNPRKAAVG
jgi:hypothetical protein